MNKRKITIIAIGWYWFCPVQFTDLEIFCPIPRPLWLGWLLALANAWQQFLNFCFSFIDEDACGFVARVTPLRKPYEISIPAHWKGV